MVDHLGTWIIGFRKRLNSKAVIAPVIWPITVAIAAPRTPIAGQPSRPKIIIGLRIIYKTAPIIVSEKKIPMREKIRDVRSIKKRPVVAA